MKRGHREAVKEAKKFGKPVPDEPKEIRALERKAASRESSFKPSIERLRRGPIVETGLCHRSSEDVRGSSGLGATTGRLRRGESGAEQERSRPSERERGKQPSERLRLETSSERDGRRSGGLRNPSSRLTPSSFKLRQHDPTRQGVRWEDEEKADRGRAKQQTTLNKMLEEKDDFDLLTKNKVFNALKKLTALRLLGQVCDAESKGGWGDKGAGSDNEEKLAQCSEPAEAEMFAAVTSVESQAVSEFLKTRDEPLPMTAEEEGQAMASILVRESSQPPDIVSYEVPVLPQGVDYGRPTSASTQVSTARTSETPGSLVPRTPVSREHLAQPDALTEAYLFIGGGENGKPSRLDVLEACCDRAHVLRELLGLPAQVHPADRSDFESVFQAMGKIEMNGFISEADFSLFADSAVEFCRLRAGAAPAAATAGAGSSSPAAKPSLPLLSWREGRPEESTRSAPSVKPLFPGTKVGPAFVLKRDAAATLAEQCAAAVLERKEREGRAEGAAGGRTADEQKIEEVNERRRREAEKARVEAFEAFERKRAEAARLRQVEREQAVTAATLGVTEVRRLAREAQEVIRLREHEAKEEIRRREREECDREKRVAVELKALAEEAEREALWEAEAAKQTATAVAVAERAKREAEEEFAAAEAAKARLMHAKAKREAEEKDAEEAEAAVAAGVPWTSSRPDSPWGKEPASLGHALPAQAPENISKLDAVTDSRIAEQQSDEDYRLRSFISALGTEGGVRPDDRCRHADPTMTATGRGHAPLVAHSLQIAPYSPRSLPASLQPPRTAVMQVMPPPMALVQDSSHLNTAHKNLTPVCACKASPGRSLRCNSISRSSEGSRLTPSSAVSNLVRQMMEMESPQQRAQGLYNTPPVTSPSSNRHSYSRRGGVFRGRSNATSPPTPLAARSPSQMQPPYCVRCSLLFSEANGGCFFEQWSHWVVEGALAAFVPQRPVPDFKLRNNGGRNEILREAAGPNAKRFFMGWTHFLKIARGADGIFCHLANLKQLPVAIYLHDEQMRVARLPLGVSTDLRSVKAVAAAPALASDLRVSQLEGNFFHLIGSRIGASLVLKQDVDVSPWRSLLLRPCTRMPLSWPGTKHSLGESVLHPLNSPQSADSALATERSDDNNYEVVSTGARGTPTVTTVMNGGPVERLCERTRGCFSGSHSSVALGMSESLSDSNRRGRRIAHFAVPGTETNAAQPNGFAPAPTLSHSSAGTAAQARALANPSLEPRLGDAPSHTISRYATSPRAHSKRNESLMMPSSRQSVWRCYLLFSEANGGCFIEQWSPRYVEGALAAFMPQQSVPPFKLLSNGGRSEILRNAGGPNVKRFFVGWTHFVKSASAPPLDPE